MSSTFSGLSTVLSALQAQQKAMETTGHNISNATTEGYSRQRVVLTASDAYASPGIATGTSVGQTGTGVDIEAIERITDEFINQQINEESQGQAYWEKILQGLTQIESIFNESTTSESGLDDALNEFYEALQDLSTAPDSENIAARKTVQGTAELVADTFNSICENLLEYQSSLTEDISTNVEGINSLTSRIAALNEEIVSVENSGQAANDLRDSRDQLLKELNRYVDVQSYEDDQGNLQVTLDGNLLVSRDNSYDLTVEQTGQNESQLIYSLTGKEVSVDSGSLAATLELRDEIVAGYLDDINQMAESFAEEFNAVHQEGYDLNGDSGEDFFVINNQENAAMGLSVSETIENDVKKIAAGRFEGTYTDNEDVASVDISDCTLLKDGYQIEITESTTNPNEVNYTVRDADGNTLTDASGSPLTGTAQAGDIIDLTEEIGVTLNIKSIGEATISFDASEGNGKNASALSNVINEDKLASLNGSSLSDYYESIITSIGVKGEEAEQMLDNQEALLEQLEEEQASISGVSLDEEMTNIIKFQQAYIAASTVVTTIDEMLDALLAMV
ncbi:flagellar hook-associated protein FlgK [Halocella sp. SP3-1]|uniref:flagellar hook-associated protein FlgK n=1 Tax=Halocella sp. SP3-1 TaxID=2382161 RepID=UPI000F74CB07|nr:flagellar hook-associated protein FlgK [Halocella sp. SP3-1]AZO95889.1 flagellar hook-associated protein FlgK [Halocella sp. SP3-1]